MIFGFGLLAKIVLAWTIVFFIVFFNTFQGPARWTPTSSTTRSVCDRRTPARRP